MKLLHWASRANDRVQDFRLGIKTCGLSKKLAPTPYFVLKHVFKLLDSKDLPDTFIDYGCGNGRVLALAHRHSFRNIIGIEIDESLHLASKDNLANKPTELHCLSAENYIPPQSSCVHYFFHPFSWEIMEKLVHRIKQNAKQNNPQWLLLVNPAYYDRIIDLGFELEESLQKDRLPYEIRLLKI